MKLSELRQEVIDRGYHYIAPTTRIDGFINRAYRQICSRRLWPFLEATVEDEPPFEIPDLRAIVAVTDPALERVLQGVTATWLSHYTSDLTQTGPSVFWYLEDDTLKVYPVATSPLAVRYSKRPVLLEEEDEPLIPEEWQYLLVDQAVVQCLKDDDEYLEARALSADVKDGIVEMASALMLRNRQGGYPIIRGGSDYL